MKFSKYHGLGNDYIVIAPEDAPDGLSAEQIRRICHRNYGVGSDGILFGPAREADGFGLRIFNTDGSEAEKSGNGLRIFSRYLWDHGLVGEAPFRVLTLGGTVECSVFDNGASVRVEMGRVSFESERIPVAGAAREVLNETLTIQGQALRFCAATVGNPHCVVLRDDISESLARQLGPDIETHPLFPNRTNVQFMKILDCSNIQIEIWERGCGYTLASGSSSSAAAAVAVKLGLCDSPVAVHMPGGVLRIEIAGDYAITMTGPVIKICEGEISAEALV